VFHKPSPSPFLSGLESDKSSATFVVPKSTRNPLFEETSDRAIRTAHRRKWTLVAAVGLCLGVAVGFYVYHRTQQAAARSLTVNYLAIDALFNDEQTKFQETLKAAGDGADFTTQPDHSGSAQKFAEFARANPDDPLAWQAALRASSLFIEAKKPKDAQELLELVSRKTLRNNVAQARLRRTLAGIHADSGNFDKALAELDFAIKLPDNPVLDETKLLRAQVLYLSGKKEEAGTALRELAAAPAVSNDVSGKSVSTEASLWLGFWGL
jgi:predicted negative regulator of RcsB-dependent stress response